jgi:hypothetical protein
MPAVDDGHVVAPLVGDVRVLRARLRDSAEGGCQERSDQWRPQGRPSPTRSDGRLSIHASLLDRRPRQARRHLHRAEPLQENLVRTECRASCGPVCLTMSVRRPGVPRTLQLGHRRFRLPFAHGCSESQAVLASGTRSENDTGLAMARTRYKLRGGVRSVVNREPGSAVGSKDRGVRDTGGASRRPGTRSSSTRSVSITWKPRSPGRSATSAPLPS